MIENIILILLVVYLLFSTITLASLWKIFEKARMRGWYSIVPVYNLIVLLRISRLPVWWVIFLMLPGVQIIFAIPVFYKLSKAFGKGWGYAIGIFFMGIIFLPTLAFGKATYQNIA